jgi:hypothetical protein
MKTSLKLLAAVACLALSAITAQANSITITQVSSSGAGPSQWVYTATFVNSTVNPGDFFTLNDFGTANVVTSALPAGWTFSQALVGPNSLPATDNAATLNATFTWTGAAGTVVSPDANTSVAFNFTLGSPLSSAASALAAYTSIDQVTSGQVAGTDSRVICSIRVPQAVPVPDGGTTIALLGFALTAVEGTRRLLRSRKA